MRQNRGSSASSQRETNTSASGSTMDRAGWPEGQASMPLHWAQAASTTLARSPAAMLPSVGKDMAHHPGDEVGELRAGILGHHPLSRGLELVG